MQNRISIEHGSEAWEFLRRAVERGDTASVGISLTPARGGVQFKSGGGMWSAPLATSVPRPDRGQPCGDPTCGCS
jgi:hypothetical protein